MIDLNMSDTFGLPNIMAGGQTQPFNSNNNLNIYTDNTVTGQLNQTSGSAAAPGKTTGDFSSTGLVSSAA